MQSCEELILVVTHFSDINEVFSFGIWSVIPTSFVLGPVALGILGIQYRNSVYFDNIWKN